jgi:hypothetical protein
MKQLRMFDGRSVVLKGRVLVPKNRPGVPENGLVANELLPSVSDACTAPPNTPLVLPVIKIDAQDYYFLKNPPRGYKLDNDSASRFYEVLSQAYRSGQKEINVVVQGILIATKKGPPVGPHRDGWYPARLIFQSYKSIEAK